MLRNAVGPNQLCSIAGSVAGANTVTGTTYMEAAFSYKKVFTTDVSSDCIVLT